MPKRLLDDSFLTSPSVASVSPRAQDAFPRFILLADDFGCFDANPRVLVGKGWPLRDDVTEREVQGWLEEYAEAGMAQLWEEGGRTYCELTGWFGKHGQKHRTEYDPATNPKGSKRKTPRPPVPGGFPADSRPVPGKNPDTQSQFQTQSQDPAQPVGGKGDPRHKPVIDLFFQLWAELRGGKYRVQAKDAAQVKALLRDEPEAQLAEFERRMRAAFSDEWFRKNGSLAYFCSRWPNYEAAGKVVSLHTGPTVVGFDPYTNRLKLSDGTTREAK